MLINQYASSSKMGMFYPTVTISINQDKPVIHEKAMVWVDDILVGHPRQVWHLLLNSDLIDSANRGKRSSNGENAADKSQDHILDWEHTLSRQLGSIILQVKQIADNLGEETDLPIKSRKT